jgi:transketolase C-terminal domain/subunit
MAVLAPSDGKQLCRALAAAVAHEGPCYIRYFDGPPAFEHERPFSLGQAEVLGHPGAEIAIITYGMLVSQAVGARAALARAGLDASVIDMQSLAPLDETTLRGFASTAQLLVVLEDHLHVGGLFSAIAERLVAWRLAPHVLPLNLGSGWFKPGKLDDVLRGTGLCAESVAKAIFDHWEHRDARTIHGNQRLSSNRSIELALGQSG